MYIAAATPTSAPLSCATREKNTSDISRIRGDDSVPSFTSVSARETV